MKNDNYLKPILILALLGYFCFMFGNGLVSLTIPDEVFYAQSAKEMTLNHSWMTPYLFGQPQFEKPILFFWLLRIGYILFGVNSFAARFFPALFGIIGVIAVYLLGSIGFKDRRKAFISALVLMTCGLYVGLARTVFTDLIFTVFILLALLSFYWGYAFQAKKGPGILLFFIFSAGAVLTKGPLGLIIPLLTVFMFLFIKRELKFIWNRYLAWGVLLFSFIALPWYVWMTKVYGNEFIREFFYNDHFRRLVEAEHHSNDTWYFYPFSMVGCIFPWSFFFVFSLFSLPGHLKEKDNSFYVFLFCLVGIVFMIFQSAHSKLVSYIFPLFPALALIVGGFIAGALTEKKNGYLYLGVILGIVTVFLLPLALIIVAIWFKKYLVLYLSSKLVLSLFIAIPLIFGAILVFLVLQKKLFQAICGLAFFVPLLIYFIPFVQKDIAPYISTQDSCQYLLKNYNVQNVILSSKFFVRGVKYFTDKEVAVIDIPGTPFFSPHPVPFLNTQEKLSSFLRFQKVTYCILKKNSLTDVSRLSAQEFKITVLKIIGNEFIVKIETLTK